MSFTRRLSTRLLMGNLLVLAAGGAAFSLTFRLLASEIFDDRIRRGGQGGAGGPGGPVAGNQGLLEAFGDSVDIALMVSLAVGVIVAAMVAWFVAQRMSEPIGRIRETTRAIAEGHLGERVAPATIVELDALGQDVNQLAHKLEETELQRASLISDVTHELRTPLASIDGFVEGTVDGVFTTDEMYEAVSEETSRLLRLVEDLSLLSKTAEHSLSLDVAPVVLSAIAASIVEQLRPQYTDKTVAVHVVVNADPEVSGDEARIGQVVTNLHANALGHVEEGGAVQVLVDADAESATISVIDDGEGIKEEDLDLVFDRFFRGSGAARRSGTGLGLPVARGIAEAHGGSLVAASDGLGKGAVFTLTLPQV